MGAPWSSAQMRELEQLAAEGLSGSQIGARLGFTRSAILGRAHRSGIRLHGKAPGRPKNKRPPKPPTVGGHRGRRKGQYLKPRALILQCVALHLAGVSQVKAAKAFGVSHQSISLVWLKDAALVSEARVIADRALAEARAAARRRHDAALARKAAERAEVDRFNELVFLTLKLRHVAVLRAYLETQNMALAAERFGLTRERVRQVVVAAERKGFIRPATIVNSRHGFARRAA